MHGQDTILAHLKAIFGEVVSAVTSGHGERWNESRLNAKGDQVKWFDLVADQTVCSYLQDHFPCPVRLLSEEGEPRQFGAGKPEFTMVLDPVDGSDNFSRGIAPSSMAVALVPANLPITTDTVQLALVGDLFSGNIWLAERGRGAFNHGNAIRTRQVTRLEKAMISCELNHFKMDETLSRLLSRAGGVRALGCATRTLVMVAYGALDAHLDLRGRLTPENLLAPSLILTEAGGIITDPEGKPLPKIKDLKERYSILAAATLELHTTLVQQLNSPDTHER